MSDRAFTDQELMTLSRIKGADLSKLTPEETARLAKLRGVGAPDPSQGPEPDTYWGGFGRGLKQYGEDLATGRGSARGDALDAGKKIASGFAHTANPLNIPGNVLSFVTNPVGAAQSLADTAHGVMDLDPEAVGSALGMVALPKATEGLARGVNRAGTLLRDSGPTRDAVGTITGLGIGGATGHVFMGPAIGRKLAPILKYPGSELADMTAPIVRGFDRLQGKGAVAEPFAPNKSGYQPGAAAAVEDDPFAPQNFSAGPKTNVPPPSDGFTPEEQAFLKSQNYTPEMMARMSAGGRNFGPITSPADVANRARNAPYGNGTILPSKVAPSEGPSILPQEPASSPTMTVRQDAVPPLHDDPSMVAPGEERGYNESRVDQPRVHPSADDMIYNEMSRSLNMGGNAADHVAPDAASRPKLSTTEAAQYLRDQYGSDKAARMLYGPSRPGSDLTEAGRKSMIIDQTAPGPYPLPAAARATIDQALASMSPEEKAAYAAKAPNPLARAYIESQLAK